MTETKLINPTNAGSPEQLLKLLCMHIVEGYSVDCQWRHTGSVTLNIRKVKTPKRSKKYSETEKQDD